MPLFGNAGAWQRQDRLRADARRAVHRAESASAARGLTQATPDALLLALLEDADDAPARSLTSVGIDVAALREILLGALPVRPVAVEGATPLDAAAREAVVLGLNEARRMAVDQAGALHLVLGIVEARTGAGARYLRQSGLNLDRLRALVAAEDEEDEDGSGAALFQDGFGRLLAMSGGETRCPHCGASLHQSFRFCYACGTGL